jgi:hypothetical protein
MTESGDFGGVAHLGDLVRIWLSVLNPARREKKISAGDRDSG